MASLVLEDQSLGSIFYLLSWSSHRAEWPVRSIGAAEVLAAIDGIDKFRMLTRISSGLCGVQVPLIVALDSKNLFSSTSTQRQSIDRAFAPMLM